MVHTKTVFPCHLPRCPPQTHSFPFERLKGNLLFQPFSFWPPFFCSENPNKGRQSWGIMRLIALEQLRDQSLLIIWRHCRLPSKGWVTYHTKQSQRLSISITTKVFGSHCFSWTLTCETFSFKQMKMAKLYNSATKFIWRFRVWLQFWMVVWCCLCSLNPFRMQIFLFSLFCGFQA